ncbi:hypothetical protein AN958_03929 [Leucoagaricus sp. SymC.cos]|nr:hypothetical protein AN958_03929 [Leucoagaricus sp. SymC.cos]
MPTLTEHLVNLSTVPPYADAINHPFLVAAGNGTLSPDRLALWLSQDRIYAAHAYPSFIGALITNIPWDSSHPLGSPPELRNQRVLSLLVYCLENVVREVNFFKDTAAKWGLPIEGWKERKGTRDYTAEMARISKNGSLSDGLIFLWAMERVCICIMTLFNFREAQLVSQVYLDAWTFVHNQLQSSGQDRSSAVATFATNWSSPDFIDFVNKLVKVVDDLNIQPGTGAWKRAEDIWTRVVELEVDFWPVEGEEVSRRLSPN